MTTYRPVLNLGILVLVTSVDSFGQTNNWLYLSRVTIEMNAFMDKKNARLIILSQTQR